MQNTRHQMVAHQLTSSIMPLSKITVGIWPLVSQYGFTLYRWLLMLLQQLVMTSVRSLLQVVLELGEVMTRELMMRSRSELSTCSFPVHCPSICQDVVQLWLSHL